MKIKHFVFSMLLGTALVSSCSDSENTVVGTEPTDPKVDTPAAGFTYATSRNVEFALKSQVTTVVSVYSDKECTPNGLLVEDLRVSSEAKSLELNIPIGCNKLYIEYPTANGKKITPYEISDVLTRAAAVQSLPEDAVAATSEQDAGFTFLHNTGVVMFEDEWPEIARDNDYNDVVMEYDLKVTECNDESLFASQGYKEGLLMTMDVRAIGGLITTQVGVALKGLDKKFIKTIDAKLMRKAGDGVKVGFSKVSHINRSGIIEEIEADAQGGKQYKLYIDTTQDDLIIYLDGLRNLADQERFYQVDPKNVIEGVPMVRVEIEIKGDLRISSSDKQEQLLAYRKMITKTENQDFFIRKYDGKSKEIHMRGYQPTYAYAERYSTDAGEWANEPVKYAGTNNFTWGLKLPAGTKHVQEKVDIKDAYPEYAEWVSSGGAENKDWYLHPDPEKVIKYW